MFYIAEKIKPRGTRNQTMCFFYREPAGGACTGVERERAEGEGLTAE